MQSGTHCETSSFPKREQIEATKISAQPLLRRFCSIRSTFTQAGLQKAMRVVGARPARASAKQRPHAGHMQRVPVGAHGIGAVNSTSQPPGLWRFFGAAGLSVALTLAPLQTPHPAIAAGQVRTAETVL